MIMRMKAMIWITVLTVLSRAVPLFRPARDLKPRLLPLAWRRLATVASLAG